MPLLKTSNPLFLIDDSLDWNVADALHLVGYNVTSVYKAFNGESAIKDPLIIQWCKTNFATWVHADDKARKEHKKDIITSGIRFLWVYRPGGKMSSKEQLRILSYVLPDLIDKYLNNTKKLHYRASAHGEEARKRIRLEPIDI
jgi:hypothetical protein